MWTINTHVASFFADGNLYFSEVFEYGAPILIPPRPEKDGYTFLGWTPVPGVMGDEDLEFYAVFEINTYNAIFLVDGEDYAVVPTVYGEEIVAPADPVKDGYTFQGWDPIPGIMGADDEIFNALWSRNPISLTPKDGSPAIIDDTNGFIYGLKEGITADEFYCNYVQVSEGGTLRFTFYSDSFGTGTKVELVDSETDEVINTYYIVIFGDVDGDGYITGSDENLMAIAVAGQGGFDGGSPFELAADLAGGGTIDNDDLAILRAATRYMIEIDQSNPAGGS